MRSLFVLTFVAATLLASLAHSFVSGGVQIAPGTYNMTGNYQGTNFSGSLTIDADGNGTSTVETPNWGTDTWEFNTDTGQYKIIDDAGQGPWYMEFTPTGNGGYNGKYVPGPVHRGVTQNTGWVKLR